MLYGRVGAVGPCTRIINSDREGGGSGKASPEKVTSEICRMDMS